ncbi:acyltransferase domain-containing protein [Pseudoalteromonas sp. MMG013]|uniref:type I polyketide synthase n=1 Tax=Pseudoalteromonas sp. MMG013 TaxID=2822687 RepID=UPI001B35B1DA|nr:type I polyketide synthase [Pseudoalteromonas sp. MMG013]MBQ4862220.1 acyltransferase domain-containing protein [Pseudoalteromonas sp. MMG013]
MTEQDSSSLIAIVGMAGRFPQAENLQAYWENLASGRESIERKEQSSAAHHQSENSNFIHAHSTLNDIKAFDAEFFNMTPADAEVLDPQQRIFLESCYHAIEDAGYTNIGEVEDVRCGIFAGSSISTYLLENLYPNRTYVDRTGLAKVLWGNDKDYLTTLVAYKLGLKGPCVSINTACSTSLVAVSQACSSLLNYETDMALAGGVRVDLAMREGYQFEPGSIFSPDGHCRVFDKDAQGTIFADGCGVVVLKRLTDAIADKDNIHAVISGYAINNDGNDKVGFSAPSQIGQTEVIKEAWELAGISGQDISYIEAHGTGTLVGDPIEVAALQSAFGASTSQKGFCALGSVKSNIGHCGSAAGIASLLKVILAIKNKQIPASVNFVSPNPAIDFENSALFVNTELRQWSDNKPRIAGVSAFGIGGTNCHLVVQEYVKPQQPSETIPMMAMPISAYGHDILSEYAKRLQNHLHEKSNNDLHNAAFTLAFGRSILKTRGALVPCPNSGIKHINNEHQTNTELANDGVVFMFPGQGCQYLGMGIALYKYSPVFRSNIELCARQLSTVSDIVLLDYFSDSSVSIDQQAVNETNITQPLMFCFEYALAKLYMSWGVKPVAMVGHSLGEIVAACLAGVWDLKDALQLVVTRAQLMQKTTPGKMLSVAASASDIHSHLPNGCEVVAYNAPQRLVIAGPDAKIIQLQANLSKVDIAHKLLPTTRAFHCESVTAILEALQTRLSTLTFGDLNLPIVSTLTGQWLTQTQAKDVDYWLQHARQSVQFVDAMEVLKVSYPNHLFVEMGPAAVLGELAKQNGITYSQILASQQFSELSQHKQWSQLMLALGQCWVAGIDIDWHSVYHPISAQRCSLPNYPFKRTQFWVSSELVDRPSPNCATPKAWVPVIKQLVDAYNKPDEAARCHLVLSKGDGLAKCIVSALKSTGHTIIHVLLGQQLVLQEGKELVVRTGVYSDLAALLEFMTLSRVTVHSIFYAQPLQGHDDMLQPYLCDIMNIAKVLDQDKHHSIRQVKVLNCPVNAQGNPLASTATFRALGAACMVLDEELHDTSVTCIDVCHHEDELSSANYQSKLAHMLVGQSQYTVQRFRFGMAWSERLEPHDLVQDAGQPIQDQGHYLVTGANGELGKQLCQWLSNSYKVHLTVLLRHALPDDEQWPDMLNDESTSDANKVLVKFLLALKAQCLSLSVVSSSVESLELTNERLVSRCSGLPLNGIFHLAGVKSQEIVTEKSAGSLSASLSPKVEGSQKLLALAKQQGCDFMVLFSSISSLIGGIGQFEYAAANAYMNGLSTQSEGETSVISVVWDRWERAQGESEVLAHLKANNPHTLKSTEGFDMLSRILQSKPSTPIVVSSRALSDHIVGQRRISEAVPSTVTQSDIHATEQFDTTTQQVLADIWCSTMRLSNVKKSDDFLLLGGDSLIGLKVLAQIEKAFGVSIPTKRFLECSAFIDMAEEIDAVMNSNNENEDEFEEVVF